MIKKILKSLFILTFCTAAFLMQTNEVRAEWKQDNNQWWYSSTSERGYFTGWNLIDGEWYHFGNDGWMQTGWVNDNDTWYFLNQNGTMRTGWYNDDGTWYFLNQSGAMQTGWVTDSGTWYFLNQNGSMQTGWVDDNGKWYYLNKSGAMQTGWLFLNNNWYYLKSYGYGPDLQGVMALSWFYDPFSEGYYYATDSGALFMGDSLSMWGKTYYFKENGMCTSKGIFNA